MDVRRIAPTVLVAAAVAVAAGCGSDKGGGAGALPQGSEQVKLDPADFTTKIDNPYWPMAPGKKWVYRERDGEGDEKRVEITVTSKTKRILGIDAVVVHDIVTSGGNVVEDTYDWYAQDRAGNLWYLGEDTKEYENGAVSSTAGSWEAGREGAQPGVALPGEPAVGMSYRQEYFAGEAEDAAEVLSVTEQASVPFGDYTDVLLTRDVTPLHPELVEHKFYARGVGPVLALTVAGGADREELVRLEP